MKPCDWDSHEHYERLIGPLRETARDHGYALAVHGSLVRDIDLIACAWVDTAAPAPVLAKALLATVAVHNGGVARWSWRADRDPEYTLAGCPGSKPHGRLCWVINLTRGAGPYIDLSVFPARDTAAEPEQ